MVSIRGPMLEFMYKSTQLSPIGAYRGWVSQGEGMLEVGLLALPPMGRGKDKGTIRATAWVKATGCSSHSSILVAWILYIYRFHLCEV